MNAKFDGLAKNYEKSRPRYPQEVFIDLKKLFSAEELSQGLNILDLGVGTGIALEGMLKEFTKQHKYNAVDISQDMINVGKQKFPDINWLLSSGEELDRHFSEQSLDLVIAAQSFQWMNIPVVLKILKKILRSNGIFNIIQNNRNHKHNEFLNRYESILEKYSPGYSRNYRDFDFKEEIKEHLGFQVAYKSYTWVREMSKQEFINMSLSSTQVQRALVNNRIAFMQELEELLDLFLHNDCIQVEYVTESFLAYGQS